MKLKLMLVAALAVASALGQGPGGRFMPWWDMPLARDLNLSEDQHKRIREVLREFRPKLIDQRAAVEKAEAELEDIYAEETVDERRGEQAVERLVAARGELTRNISLMGLRMRSVLTAEQWKQLRRHPRFQPGPRMPRGPRGEGRRGERPQPPPQ